MEGGEGFRGAWGNPTVCVEHATYESTSMTFHLCDARPEVMLISMVIIQIDPSERHGHHKNDVMQSPKS